MKILYALLFMTIPLLDFGQVNLVQVGNLDYQALHNTNLSDIWGYVDQQGNEYALVGMNDGGISVVNISDPANPNEVFFTAGPSTIWRDLKVWEDYAYITNEASGGLTIIDLSTLPNDPNLDVTNYDSGGWGAAHNLFIDENGICYVFGANAGNDGVRFLDLTQDPMAPMPIGGWSPWYAHDGMVRGDTMYIANVEEGFFSIVDVSDKSNPQLLATHPTGNNYTHNVWLSDDGNYLFTTDEVPNGYLGAYDISDLSDIQEIDLTISAPGTNTIIHNTHFLNEYLITSYYTYGITIHDVSRPSNMVEVGHYDTSPFVGPGFSGSWGAYPWLPSGLILASDVETGLHILEPTYVRACWLEGSITDANTTAPIMNAEVSLLNIEADALSDFAGAYKTGYHTGGTYTMVTAAAGYAPDTITGLELVNGQVTLQDVQLVPLVPFDLTGQVTEVGSGDPIENAKLSFRSHFYDHDITTDMSGNFTINGFLEAEYDVYVGNWGHKNVCLQGFLDENSTPVDFELETGYYDDFSVDLGWQVTGNAGSGAWARGEPQGQYFDPFQIVPNDDLLSDCGTEAFVTGIFGQVGQGAVSGTTVLTSPEFDATLYTDPHVNFYFWFTNIGLGIPPNDTLRIELDNGIETVTVENITPSTNEMMDWFLRSFAVADHLTPTANTKLMLTAKKPDTNDPELLEVVVDLFQVTGQSIVSVPENEFSDQLLLRPNPSNGTFVLDMNIAPDERMDLQIFNLQGKSVFQKANALTSGSNQLNVDLPKGLYIVYASNINHRTTPVKLTIH